MDDLPQLGLYADVTWYISTPPREWFSAIDVESNDLLLSCVAAVLQLVTPEWQSNRPNDSVPIRAIEAALNYAENPSRNIKKHVSTLAKGCSSSRRKSLGYEHRIAEAARAFANASVAENQDRTVSEIAEALSKTEEHILYKHSIKAEYGKEAETRQRMLEAFVNQLRTLNG